MNTNNPRWATARELSEAPYFIGESTQAKFRMNKKIPFYKVGKYIRYDLNEIDNWILNHKVGAVLYYCNECKTNVSDIPDKDNLIGNCYRCKKKVSVLECYI
jgi:hypothetical protein